MARFHGRDSHSSGAPVARRLTQPTRTTGLETGLARRPRCPYSVLLPVGFTMPPLLPVARWALTPPFHPYPGWILRSCRGGLLSVALSLRSPSPGVTRHRVPMEPGLSSPAAFRHLRQRLSGRLAPADLSAFSGKVKRQPPAAPLFPLKLSSLTKDDRQTGLAAAKPCHALVRRWSCLAPPVRSHVFLSKLKKPEFQPFFHQN